MSVKSSFLGRSYRIDGRVWVVSAVITSKKPWAWLVNVAQRKEQARYPLAALELLAPER